MFLRDIQSDGWNWALFSCLFILSERPATAQLSLSTTGGVQCYGERVTLLCTHPPLPKEPEYLSTEVSWRRDGRAISAVGLGRTNLNSTTTKLEFTITNSTVGSYTCFLVNAVQGGASESNTATVRPRDLTPPPLTSIDSLASTITLKWSDQPCTVRYSVSWMYTNDDGTATTDSGVTELTNYTIPASVGGVYTVSVEAVDGVGLVGPSTTEVVRSTYPRPVATRTHQPSCEDRSMTLTCQVCGTNVSETYRAITWMDTRGPLVSSSLYTVGGDLLVINDVTAIVGVKMFRCSVEMFNRITVRGVGYSVSSPADLTCITSGPPAPTPSTALAALVVVPVLLLIFAVLAVVGVACLWRKPSKVEEDKSYMNVELEDKSVPMTDNPSYEHVQRTQLTRPLYGNL